MSSDEAQNENWSVQSLNFPPPPPQTYLRRSAPRRPRSHSPSHRRIAMTTRHICWQPLRNQTSLVDRSVGLL